MKHVLIALSAVLSTLLLSVTSSAALLTLEASSEKLEKVTLASSATITVEGQPLKLTQIGAGLRAKKVVFVNVKVYVAELFVDAPEKFKKSASEALTSLKDEKAVAIQLHFLRTVDADTVQKSFREAFSANNIGMTDASIKQFLDSVSKGGDVQEGKALTILGTHFRDGSESVSYESTSGGVIEVKGSAGFIEKVFAIWLGKSSDDGVAQLKKSLLKS